MKSGAEGRRRTSFALSGLEPLEIAAIAHRDDDALRRDHDPTTVLALDLLDRPDARQGRARHDLIDVAVTLHVDETVARLADRPAGDDRRTTGNFRCWSRACRRQWC